MGNLIKFKLREGSKCDCCKTLGGEMIQNIGINKIVKCPYYDYEYICLDCLDLLHELKKEDDE